MRSSNAESAAFAPSPMEMMICLYGTVDTSPAAYIPGNIGAAMFVDYDFAYPVGFYDALENFTIGGESDLDKNTV